MASDAQSRQNTVDMLLKAESGQLKAISKSGTSLTDNKLVPGR